MNVDQINARIKELKNKYNYVVDLWFKKHTNQHKLYEDFDKLRQALDGKLDLKEKGLKELERKLQIVFPEDRFFGVVDLLESSDDDDQNNNFEHNSSTVSSQVTTDLPSPRQPTHANVPNHNKNSIAEYNMKTIKLRPAAAYAKPSSNENRERKIITVPYKNANNKQIPKKAYNPAPVKEIFNVKNYDPKEEALKLAGIKEKIYAQTFLNAGQDSNANASFDEPEKTSNDASMNTSIDPIAESSMNASNTQEKVVIIKAPKKVRNQRSDTNKKRKQKPLTNEKKIAKFINEGRPTRKIVRKSYVEPQSDKESESEDEDFEQVPITKSQASRRKVKIPRGKKEAKKAKAGTRNLKNRMK